MSQTPLDNRRPEYILSAMGDMVFDGDEGYEDLLESWREQFPNPDNKESEAPR